MSKIVLVTGASGFIGFHLAAARPAAASAVGAMPRHPENYDGAGEAVAGDVSDAASLAGALDGVDVAYYLVHSLTSGDFQDKDSTVARNSATACADAGVERIVYLGGLGSDDEHLSPHLRSRRRVEQLLQAG